MTASDLTHALALNLEAGTLERRDGVRLVGVPGSVIDGLLERAGPASVRELASRWGRELAPSLSTLTERSVSAVLSRVSEELALSGLGGVELEQWGRALVFVFRDAALTRARSALLAGLLEGLLREAFGRPLVTVALGDGSGPEPFRVLVCGVGCAERARAALNSGLGWRQVLASIHEPPRQATEASREWGW